MSDQNQQIDGIRELLMQLNARLDGMEQRNAAPAPANSKPFHVSQQRFSSLEEIADAIIGELNTEKPCPYEPTAKPCDNCSMCSSRGF